MLGVVVVVMVGGAGEGRGIWGGDGRAMMVSVERKSARVDDAPD